MKNEEVEWTFKVNRQRQEMDRMSQTGYSILRKRKRWQTWMHRRIGEKTEPGKSDLQEQDDNWQKRIGLALIGR